MKLLGMSQVVFVAIATTLLVNAVTTIASSSPSWTLFHSLDGNSFTPRGRVIPTGGGSGDDDDDSILKVIPLDGELADEFKVDVEYAKSAITDYGWYHVWLLKNEDGPNQNPMSVNMKDPVAIATVPACDLVRANFRDEFTFVLGRYGADDKGEIVSMSYAPIISPLAPKLCDEELFTRRMKVEEGIAFVSKVTDVSADTPGMTLKNVLPHVKPPPGMAFIKNPNKAKAGKGGGSPDGEKAEPEPITGPMGFIKRYWYILLPLFLGNFISAEPPAEEGQEGQSGGGQQQGGGSGGGGGSAAVAPAASAASSPGKKSRRGKRH